MSKNSGVESTKDNEIVTKTDDKLTNQKKPKKSYPSTAAMVQAAISSLNDRQGSSISSIMKYIESNYEVDMPKLKIHIKRYMKDAVAKELLIQTKGHGFIGSFKLPLKSKKVTVDNDKVAEKSSKKPIIAKDIKIPTDKIKEAKKPAKVMPDKSPTVESKVKATGKSKAEASVPKEPAVVKKRMLFTREKANEKVKNPSKAKKIKSPVAKKTPRPKRMIKPKATN